MLHIVLMGERQQAVRPEHMATTSTAVSTVPQPLQEESVERVAVITLRPAAETREQTRKKVVWTEDTVDNEHMNKKKSKCCCIYKKPRKFDESDSESSDDECEHCFGHVEKKRAHHATREQALTITETDSTVVSEPTATISLQPPNPEPQPPEPSPQPPDKAR